MSSSDFDHNYYTLPRHGQSSESPKRFQGRGDSVDSGEGTQWIPSSSSPPQGLPRSSSPDYSNTRTPYASPQRPYLSTNLQNYASNGRINGLGDLGKEDNSPDPHEFYQHFDDPFVARTGTLGREEDRENQRENQMGFSYQRTTAASTARSQGLTSKYSTLNSPPRPSRHTSSQSPTSVNTGAITPNERSRQPSLKDLVDRFNQTNDEPPLPPGRPTPSRNTSTNNVSFLRSRTPSASTPTLRELSTAGGQSRTTSSSRPTSRRKLTNEDVPTTNRNSRPDRSRLAIATNSSATDLPPDQSTSDRHPLFGEIMGGDLTQPVLGSGYEGHQRRGSEGSLYPPSPIGRGMEYSPSSPTAWYLGAAPSLEKVDPTKLEPNGNRGHRRARSDFAGDPSTPGNNSGLGKFVATISPPPESPHRSSQSRIPLSTRRLSPLDDSTAPRINLSSRYGSDMKSPARNQTSIPKPHRASESRDQNRPKTPSRPNGRRTETSSPRIDTQSSNSLKAYISAPLPKKSPPLRSSRPRQPISSSSNITKGKTVDRNNSYSQEGTSSQDQDRDGNLKPKPKKLPELGGVDFAARRERIQRAFTKSVRESERKSEIIRRRVVRTGILQDEKESESSRGQIVEDAEDSTNQQPEDLYERLRIPNDESLSDEHEIDPSIIPSSQYPLDESTLDEINLTLDTLLPATRYNADIRHEQKFDTPDSPTLGMPGSFPSYDDGQEPPITISEKLETGSTTSTKFRESSSPPPSRNVLSQILQMRQSDQESPARHHDYSPSEGDGKESIQIMLGATPNLNTSSERHKSYWNHQETDRSRWTFQSNDSTQLSNTYGSQQQHSSMDPISEASLSPQETFDTSMTSDGQDWTRLEKSRENQNHDTMDSDAYSAINRVLSQYHSPHDVDPEMMRQFQQQILGLSPELARQGGWDPTRVTQLYLQELTKDDAKHQGKSTLPKMDTEINQDHHDADDLTPVTDIDHDTHNVDRPRGYQLSDGGWSSARHSISADDPEKSHDQSSANPDNSSEWIDASPSMADWIHPQMSKDLAADGKGSKYRPLPPPKDSPFSQDEMSRRNDNSTPKLNNERPILPEIESAGDGLGIALQDHSGADSPTIPPFPDHSPPIPPDIDGSLGDGQIPSFNRTTNSPSIYSKNPPSSIFPSVFPDGMAAGPTPVRISGDESSHSHSRSPGTPLAPSQTPPTSDSRSQERPSQDLVRQSLDGQRKDSAPSAEQKRLAQRRFIIKELVDTEKSFLQDMTVTDEIYKGTASPPLNPEDVKTLFGNSDQIVAFSKCFLDALKQAAVSVYAVKTSSGTNSKRASVSTSGSIDHSSNLATDLTDDEKDRKTFIGEAFGQHMSRMEKVYSEYLKNHDAANKRLAKIQSIQNVVIWLQECRTNADDLTTAWSLDSLLVKPVQRILKYPLILGQLLEVTPENHPDFTALDVAVREMTGASHRINEMKKRADVLEKVVGRKRKESDVRTGLSKAFGRRTEKFRQQVGLSDMFEDREYAEIAQKFGSHFMHLHLVMKDVEIYTTDIQTGVDRFIQYITAVENFVQVVPSSFPELESKWRKFSQAMREMATIALNEHVSP
jgi:hypothetical protein